MTERPGGTTAMGYGCPVADRLDPHAAQEPEFRDPTRHFLKYTVTESFEYDPAQIDRLYEIIGPTIPGYMLAGDEATNQESRVIALFTAMKDALVSPFGSREDYDVGHELYEEDE